MPPGLPHPLNQPRRWPVPPRSPLCSRHLKRHGGRPASRQDVMRRPAETRPLRLPPCWAVQLESWPVQAVTSEEIAFLPASKVDSPICLWGPAQPRLRSLCRSLSAFLSSHAGRHWGDFAKSQHLDFLHQKWCHCPR